MNINYPWMAAWFISTLVGFYWRREMRKAQADAKAARSAANRWEWIASLPDEERRRVMQAHLEGVVTRDVP